MKVSKMLSFKYAGPTRFMYYTKWRSEDKIISNKRPLPNSIMIDHKEYKSPIELSSSFHDVTSIQKFWDTHYETSDFKINTTIADINKLFINEGKCLSLKDSNKNIFATLFSYNSEGFTYINGKLQDIRFIDGAVVNHKMKREILEWLFLWMEYLYPSIYIYTSDNLPNSICSSYITYNYHAISTSFISTDSIGDVERMPKTEFGKFQELYIKTYKHSLNFIHNLKFDSLDIELYKVPMKFHSNAYYVIAVNSTKKIYKKFNIPVYEVIFCISVATDNKTIINPSEDEKYLTRYAIESVCKAGNYTMLMVSTKEVSGDIYNYDNRWQKLKINRKKLYIYNYLANGSGNASIYFPK